MNINYEIVAKEILEQKVTITQYAKYKHTTVATIQKVLSQMADENPVVAAQCKQTFEDARKAVHRANMQKALNKLNGGDK